MSGRVCKATPEKQLLEVTPETQAAEEKEDSAPTNTEEEDEKEFSIEKLARLLGTPFRVPRPVIREEEKPKEQKKKRVVKETLKTVHRQYGK